MFQKFGNFLKFIFLLLYQIIFFTFFYWFEFFKILFCSIGQYVDNFSLKSFIIFVFKFLTLFYLFKSFCFIVVLAIDFSLKLFFIIFFFYLQFNNKLGRFKRLRKFSRFLDLYGPFYFRYLTLENFLILIIRFLDFFIFFLIRKLVSWILFLVSFSIKVYRRFRFFYFKFYRYIILSAGRKTLVIWFKYAYVLFKRYFKLVLLRLKVKWKVFYLLQKYGFTLDELDQFEKQNNKSLFSRPKPRVSNIITNPRTDRKVIDLVAFYKKQYRERNLKGGKSNK